MLPSPRCDGKCLGEQGLPGRQRKYNGAPDLVSAVPQAVSPSSYQVSLITFGENGPSDTLDLAP